MAKEIESISLLDILPPNLQQDEKIIAAAKAIDGEMQKVTADVKECIQIARIDELPEKVIDLLAWQWHVDFYEPVKLNITKKRDLIKQSIAWHRMKGTPAAVESVVSAAFDKSTVLEWFEYGGQPFFFKVRTEDATTDSETIAEMKRAIASVKNTRSWLEKIEFVLHLKDDYGATSENLVIEAKHKMTDTYPWEYQKYDGSVYYGDVARYNDAYRYDGALHYDMAVPGTIHYNAKRIDAMGIMAAELAGMKETHTTVMRYDGKNTYNGVQFYRINSGPQDDGGGLTIRRGIYYNGNHVYDGGGAANLYNGALQYNGAAVYDGGNVRRYKFEERVERF
ncbi:phage tail protein I [Pectinatus frisingensis]|uniref:phage tail protein I n=1 Tax=Pectinatus frisingensis TaxID=865 RepID=UPI0018C48B3F|nr:phage tail protein I [Pectinatus frisingensis]